ncbi:hypothetical protein [Rubricoccus marinus]|uniref:Nucleotide modification associated domain-containing protein n=1 Tax=Rubricoccus marinus TaxID=716817 RepID=A0A259TVC6_9BACT|nr:hypothetical protein [Rubricoccus marinus]OZC01719.1 hypothetical protein BSZ36_01200 [Rubricoccus marinus]
MTTPDTPPEASGDDDARPPRFFLCSTWPLCKTRGGREAVLKYALPPFVNGMSRREPDLEHRRPAITASSRGRNFAPRLRPGDTVLYTTTKGRWGEVRTPHWRLLGALTVEATFASHEAAAADYRARGLRLPSNLVVDGNAPLPVPLTLHHGRLHTDEWDAVCRERAQASGAVAVCAAHAVELFAPPVLTPEALMAIFGTVPNTRTPPEITEAQADRLWDLAQDPPEAGAGLWRRAA